MALSIFIAILLCKKIYQRMSSLKNNLRIAISFLVFISIVTFFMTNLNIYLLNIFSYGMILFAFAMFLDSWESKKEEK